ncbi:MAG: PAS domain S-box protein [Helicobacteraceae bacterium]|nr:PAS domain S-box protein [Helicobacteraceae bacterium]
MQQDNKFIVSLDSGAVIVEFNEIAEQVSGYSKEEVMGKNWFNIFIPDSDLVEVLYVFNDLFYGTNITWENINDIKCKDTQIKTFKFENNIIKDKHGKAISIHSVGTEL